MLDILSMSPKLMQLFFFFFDISAQEGGEEFELATSASLGVVLADWTTS